MAVSTARSPTTPARCCPASRSRCRVPALIQPQVQVTGADGSYRFLALPPGVYAVDFELTGFQTVKREGIRVVINQTLSVDQQLQVATLQETVTVTGESPVVDTTTTTMGTNFTKELLTEIPNARDVWAAMAAGAGHADDRSTTSAGRAPATRPTYRSYGMDDQNQTKLEGIDTTEATNANAGYFDYGSFEEFQVGGAGADASAFGGGAVLSISVKSGSDRFTGNWYSDFQNEDMIANNVPELPAEPPTSATTTASSPACRSSAATRSRSSTTSTATSAARCGAARSGASTATA